MILKLDSSEPDYTALLLKNCIKFMDTGCDIASPNRASNPAPARLDALRFNIPAEDDPRAYFADWMTDPRNPLIARSPVNCFWTHFMGRGLVEPEDDIRDTNPPTNPELLAALEEHFVASGFDLRELIRVITNSKAYQLSAIPNEHNVVDRQNYSRFYPKRMQAEVMLDAIDQLAGTTTSFANLPVGTSAVALPDNSYNKASPFLRVFGRPEATSVCECERVQSGSLAQSLHLMNAADIKSKLSAGSGRVARLHKSDDSVESIANQLYLAAFARKPSGAELAIAKDYLSEERRDAKGNPVDAKVAMRGNLEDLVWALINTREFLFNH